MSKKLDSADFPRSTEKLRELETYVEGLISKVQDVLTTAREELEATIND